jgi:membrane-bound ClpP family serine protease
MLNNFYLTAALLAVAFPSLVMLFFLLKLVIHSRRIKMNPSADRLIGMTGRAESEIAEEGLVFVRGELWPARSELKITRGKRVRVIGCSRLMLEVEIA